MSDQKRYIGIDLGATNVRAALVCGQDVLRTVSSGINADGSVEEVLETMFGVTDELRPNEAAGIGVGVPSVVDVDAGIVYDVQNIPSMKEVAVKKRFEARYGRPTFVNNDVNCFVLGEYAFGKARGFRHVAGLNFGTGFAAGLILNGRLYEGPNCGAGEFGMIPYEESILEDYCSGLFFKKRGLDAADMYREAESGDGVAKSLWEEFGHHVGNAVKTVLYSVDPEIIVVGGSIRKAYGHFSESMWQTVNDFGFPQSLRRLQFELSDLEHAPLLGAAALPRSGERKEP